MPADGPACLNVVSMSLKLQLRTVMLLLMDRSALEMEYVVQYAGLFLMFVHVVYGHWLTCITEYNYIMNHGHRYLADVQVCNNRRGCSCNVGFTGANCETPFNGPGGMVVSR